MVNSEEITTIRLVPNSFVKGWQFPDKEDMQYLRKGKKQDHSVSYQEER
jgi:hypothetical protein